MSQPEGTFPSMPACGHMEGSQQILAGQMKERGPGRRGEEAGCEPDCQPERRPRCHSGTAAFLPSRELALQEACGLPARPALEEAATAHPTLGRRRETPSLKGKRVTNLVAVFYRCHAWAPETSPSLGCSFTQRFLAKEHTCVLCVWGQEGPALERWE